MGEVVGNVPIKSEDQRWCEFEGEVSVKDGVAALYFTFNGKGSLDFRAFKLM